MAAPSQLGTTLKIGFGNFAYSGYFPEDGLEWARDTADIDEVRNVDNETATEIVSNPGQRLRGSFYVTNGVDATTFTPPARGDLLTITDPANTSSKWYVESCSIRMSRLALILDLELVRETSMGATYDA